MGPGIAGCTRWSRDDRWSRGLRVGASMWLLLRVDVSSRVVVAAVGRGVGCRCAAAHSTRSLLEDGLDLEADLYLVADHGAADGSSADAEVAAVDLRGRGEADPLAAVGVRA